LSVADAKARLRQAAADDAGGRSEAALAGVRLLARTRPWAALGAALAAGVVVGASKRARAELPRLLLRLVG